MKASEINTQYFLLACKEGRIDAIYNGPQNLDKKSMRIKLREIYSLTSSKYEHHS